MDGPATQTSKYKWRRWFDKISTASVVILVTFSVVGVLIVTPRPTAPHVVPLPRVDARKRDELERSERQRAELARSRQLDHRVRGIGELVRRLGQQMAQNRLPDQATLTDLRESVARLIADGRTDELLDLRALQAELFLQAAQRFERSAAPDADLLELGGQFAEVATRSWTDPSGRLVMEPNELRLLFRIHWSKLTGVYGTPPFGPSLEELRRYYSVNLQHPHAGSEDPVSRARKRLEFARALGQVDPTYPTAVAEGMLLLEGAQPTEAAQALEYYLKTHEAGPWVQVARNHLKMARAQAELLPIYTP